MTSDRASSGTAAAMPAPGEKLGIDDFLAASGPEKALELLEKAKPARVPLDKAALLERLVEEAEFFHTHQRKLYAALAINGHREIWPLNSKTFRHWLAGRFYNVVHMVSRDMLREALAVLESRAAFEGPQCRVGMRVLRSGSAIYIDLADDEWRAVEITDAGWRVVPDPPVMFGRTTGMAALPAPLEGGSINELRPFLHVGDEQWQLIVGWLVGALHPEGPYAVLVLQGEQGSGKSIMTRLLRKLIDPSTAELRTRSRDEHNLVLTANNSWIFVLDNLSGMRQWLSDALCRLSTGGGFSTRQLYTDEDEIMFDVKRPVILNGIDDIARSPDLADRSLIVTLSALPEKIPEKIYWAQFERARPRILGALLTAVAAAHRNIDRTDIPDPPRMADFATWVMAAAPALPFKANEFLQAYEANRRESVALSIEASPIASGLKRLAAAGPWVGSHTELLEKLNSIIYDDIQKRRTWPKSPRVLSSRLRTVVPLLRVEGIIEINDDVPRDPDSNVKRLSIRKTSNARSPAE